MSAVDTIRDALFGNPPVSGFKPSREGVLNAFIEMASLLATIGVGISTFQTKAAMLATTPGATDPKVAFVIADGTSANNGVYKYPTGGPWAVFTEFYNGVAAIVTPYVALANHYANDSTDVDVPGGSAGERGAKYWSQLAASILSGLSKVIDGDALVGPRALPAPSTSVGSIAGDTFTIVSSADNVFRCQLTVDELANPTATIQILLQIISGSAGTAFSTALLRWYNAVGTQVGADIALTKSASAISFNAAKPSTATNFQVHVQPPANTVVRHMVVSIGNPARPTVDPWYLTLLGAGVAGNDPKPVPFIINPFLSTTWNYATRRINIPTGGGSADVLLYGQAFDGDVVWLVFSSPLEPSAWLQYFTDTYSASSGHGGTYQNQYFRIGANQWMVAIYVQSTDAANDFNAVRFTWNNATGSPTYVENIQCFVGPNPPFVNNASKVTVAAITDAQTHAQGRPIITFAGDSTEDNSDPFAPDPRQALKLRFGDEVILRDLATPGDTLVQAAVTAGLLPVTVNVSGAVIPANTNPVTITSWPTGFDPMTSLSFANPNFDPYCWINGVFGCLSSDGSFTGNSPNFSHLFFTPVVAPPYPVEVPNGTPLILRSARESKGTLVVFPISSVNGVGGGFANAMAYVDAVFAAASNPALLAGFVGLQPGSGTAYPTGASILATYSAKSYFSRLFDVNVMNAATVAEAMSVTGWTWATGENAAWTAGTLGIPGSMRVGDGFHPYTRAGVYALAKNWRYAAPVASFINAQH